MKQNMRRVLLSAVGVVATVVWFSIPSARQAKAGCNASNEKYYTVDLIMDGIPVAQEDTIGGFLARNENDNDGTAGEDRLATSVPVANNDPDLKKITLQIMPVTSGDPAPPGTMTLTFDNSKVRVWMTQNKTALVASGVPMLASRLMELWIEGYEMTPLTEPAIIKLTYDDGTPDPGTPDACQDEIKVNVYAVDLDIDSDQTTDYGGPECTVPEDNIEAGPGSPSHEGLKFIVVNELHEAADEGLPGYADWQIGSPFGPATNEASIFVPMVLAIPPPFNNPTITFTYPAYEPQEPFPTSIQDGETIYPISPTSQAHVRIWRKSMAEARIPAAVPSGGGMGSALGIRYKVAF